MVTCCANQDSASHIPWSNVLANTNSINLLIKAGFLLPKYSVSRKLQAPCEYRDDLKWRNAVNAVSIAHSLLSIIGCTLQKYRFSDSKAYYNTLKNLIASSRTNIKISPVINNDCKTKLRSFMINPITFVLMNIQVNHLLLQEKYSK